MRIRKELERKIEKKECEIKEMEKNIAEAKAYIQGLYDSLKLFPKENTRPEEELRADSDLAKSRKVILEVGHPLHIIEILKQIGKEPNKQNKLSLAGSLSTCVRNGRIFCRTGPNIFGLIELESKGDQAQEPPDDFGI